MGMYNGDSSANDAIMPPGFFEGAQGLFGAPGDKNAANGNSNDQPVSSLFAMLNNQSNPDFNPFEMPDVNPFIMAAMDRDMRDNGNKGAQVQGLEFMLQGLTGQGPQANGTGAGFGALFGGAQLPMGFATQAPGPNYGQPIDTAHQFSGATNQEMFSPEDIQPQISPGNGSLRLT